MKRNKIYIQRKNENNPSKWNQICDICFPMFMVILIMLLICSIMYAPGILNTFYKLNSIKSLLIGAVIINAYDRIIAVSAVPLLIISSIIYYKKHLLSFPIVLYIRMVAASCFVLGVASYVGISENLHYTNISSYIESIDEINNNDYESETGILSEVNDLDSFDGFNNCDITNAFYPIIINDKKYYCYKDLENSENINNMIGSTYSIEYIKATNVITKITLLDENTLNKQKEAKISESIKKTDDSIPVEGYLYKIQDNVSEEEFSKIIDFYRQQLSCYTDNGEIRVRDNHEVEVYIKDKSEYKITADEVIYAGDVAFYDESYNRLFDYDYIKAILPTTTSSNDIYTVNIEFNDKGIEKYKEMINSHKGQKLYLCYAHCVFEEFNCDDIRDYSDYILKNKYNYEDADKIGKAFNITRIKHNISYIGNMSK